MGMSCHILILKKKKKKKSGSIKNYIKIMDEMNKEVKDTVCCTRRDSRTQMHIWIVP